MKRFEIGTTKSYMILLSILTCCVFTIGCNSKTEMFNKFSKATSAESAPVSAVAKDNEKFIQGSWRVAGAFSETGDESKRAWFLAWTFSSGNFQQNGYPPIDQKGKYRILKSDGDKLTLVLYEQSGTFGKEDKQIEIVIDKEKETMKIDGIAGFKRIEE